MEHSIYGGRIENLLDIGVLQAYLQNFFNGHTISGAREPMRIAANVEVPAALSDLKEYANFIHSTVPVVDDVSVRSRFWRL